VTSFGRCIESNDAPDDQAVTVQSSTSPIGSLELDLWIGLDFMASRFLSLPGGPRFRGLYLKLDSQQDASPITALVEGCRFTLEFLTVECSLFGVFACHLCPYKRLTPVRRTPIGFDRPLESHITSRCGACVQI
jgi:hypothetical protein